MATVRKISLASLKSRVRTQKIPKQNSIDKAYAQELKQIRTAKADKKLISMLSPAQAMDNVKNKIQVAVNMMTGKKA